MTNKTMNQNATIAIVLGAILLIAGGYQALNPVLAVSAPDDRPNIQMLAITTFEVTGADPTTETTWADGLITSINEGESVNVVCAWDYGGTAEYGAIHLAHYGPSAGITFHDAELAPTHTGSDTLSAVIPLVEADEDAYFLCVLADSTNTQIAVSHGPTYTIQDVPTPPAQIDDTSDILKCDPTVVGQGDTVGMTASGKNIGEVIWTGKVTFTVTQPDGAIYTTGQVSGINVEPDTWQDVNWNFDLPNDAASGTWTLQSRWVDDAGVIHAKASINLGTETIWGIDVNVIGAIIALIGILLLMGGIMSRKD